ncbi:hypothetical protein [Actinomyces faecalis]|uniref:hypothetical protein n=1 Tax=Actinomyces faecalis TaxID=2722820 RepID=UPI0015583236|nr:hypothetical protein [Actinomyces faecalis]
MIALGSAASDRAWEARLACEQDRHDHEVCGECGQSYPRDLLVWCDCIDDWECGGCWDYCHEGGDRA